MIRGGKLSAVPSDEMPGELVLNPGEIFFGGGPRRISTLLGSCVAMTVWHPQLRQGGLCHYLLPGLPRAHLPPSDTRYAGAAFAMLERHVHTLGAQLDECEFGIFGGGNMFPGIDNMFGGRIGRLNIEAALRFVREHGLRLKRRDIGGDGYRNIAFDPHSGTVSVRYVSIEIARPGDDMA